MISWMRNNDLKKKSYGIFICIWRCGSYEERANLFACDDGIYAFILGLEQIDDFAWCSMYKN
jgi:hypothetical protein